jgi:hypothetical protein
MAPKEGALKKPPPAEPVPVALLPPAPPASRSRRMLRLRPRCRLPRRRLGRHLHAHISPLLLGVVAELDPAGHQRKQRVVPPLRRAAGESPLIKMLSMQTRCLRMKSGCSRPLHSHQPPCHLCFCGSTNYALAAHDYQPCIIRRPLTFAKVNPPTVQKGVSNQRPVVHQQIDL